jgi:hypothetical protein
VRFDHNEVLLLGSELLLLAQGTRSVIGFAEVLAMIHCEAGIVPVSKRFAASHAASPL